jgi:UDP-perosamine 4-acetyltransferase
MKKVIGVGAGGHAKVMVEVLRLTGNYEIVGLLDPNPTLWNTEIVGVPVIGSDDLLPNIFQEDIKCAFIGIGGIKDQRHRQDLFEQVKLQGFDIIKTIHPNSYISPSAKLGQGSTIMGGVIVNACTYVGDNVIINSGAIVEHDCFIDNHVHIASGARLAGGVSVRERTLIGLGASIREGINIGSDVIIGAGAVVICDIPSDSTYVGVPARKIR